MVGFREEALEMVAINHAHSIHYCETNYNEKNLQSDGYLPPVIFQKVGPKKPDLTFYKPNHEKKEFSVLFLEVKSGHVQEEDFAKQADKYSKLNLLDVEQSFKKHASKLSVLDPFKTWKIDNFSVCFQYYNRIIRSADEKESSILDNIANVATILNCEEGQRIKIERGCQIKDKSTYQLLSDGIRVPYVPPDFILFGENPSIEFIAYRICQIVVNIRSSDPALELSAERLKFDYFAKYYNVTLGAIQVVLQNLNTMGVCTKKRNIGLNPSPLQQLYIFNDIVIIQEKIFKNIWQNKSLQEIASL